MEINQRQYFSIADYKSTDEYEVLKENLQLVMFNKERHPADTTDTFPFLADIGVQVQVLMEEPDGGLFHAPFTRGMRLGYGLDAQQLYDDTLECMSRKQPPVIEDVNGSLVVFNDIQAYGAAGVLVPNVLPEIAKTLGCSFFLLPTSVDMMTAWPDDTWTDPSELRQMLFKMNVKQPLQDKVLSGNILYYSMFERKLRTLEEAENEGVPTYV